MAAFDDLKLRRTEFRLLPAAIQAEQVARINETEYSMNINGVTITAWDYPTGTAVMTNGTGNANSTVWTTGDNPMINNMLVRIVTVAGATPTATYKIQGSNTSAFTSPVDLYYADKSDLTTFVNTALVYTTSNTYVKLLKMGQNYRYYRVNVSANTNMTTTIDVTYWASLSTI